MAPTPNDDRQRTRATRKKPIKAKASVARDAKLRTLVEPKSFASVPAPDGFGMIVPVVMGRAVDMGLITKEVHQVGARLPTKLLEQAKRRTGIGSTTDLIAFALASVAVEDNFGKAFAQARGKLDPDLDIGF